MDNGQTYGQKTQCLPLLPVVGEGITMAAKIALFMHMLDVLYFIFQTLYVTTRQVKTNIGDMITVDRPDSWHVTGTRLQYITDTTHQQN